MNRDRVQGLSKRVAGRLKQTWGALVRDPRTAADGRRDQLAGRAQEQRGLVRQKADRQLEEFMRRNRNWSDLSGR